jgi:hypothetical protein
MQYITGCVTKRNPKRVGTKILGMGRLECKEGATLVDSLDYSKSMGVIPNVDDKLDMWSTFSGGRSTLGAGYFHLVNARNLKAAGIRYPSSRRERDMTTRDGWYSTKSDVRFRNECGGTVPLRGFAPIMHLAHPKWPAPDFTKDACY